MAINVFGETINISRVTGNAQYFEKNLSEVVEKTREKRIMKKFLDGKSLSGKRRLKEIIEGVSLDINSLEGKLDSSQRDLVTQFYTDNLKAKASNQSDSLYHDLAFRLVKIEKSFDFKKQLNRFQRGKIAVTDLPDSFPGEFKKAETLLVGKIRSEIGEKEYRSYLRHKELMVRLRIIARDLFYAVNSGLSPEGVEKYMAVRFELRRLQESVPTNSNKLKKNIVTAIRDGVQLELVHIKCLRFTYPYGKRLQIIEDLEDSPVPTKNGGLHYPLSEEKALDRLRHIFNIFTEFGVPVKMVVLLSDQDLIDYFPTKDCSFLPAEDIEKAPNSIERYKEKLNRAIDFGEVDYFRDYLHQRNQLKKFDQIREETIQELQRGKSIYPESLVEERVDYRCQSNESIFVNCPDRQFARERVYAQLGSLQALTVLGLNGERENRPVILIEEDYGDQNKYIGGKRRSALPVYFTKLRNKVEVV